MMGLILVSLFKLVNMEYGLIQVSAAMGSASFFRGVLNLTIRLPVIMVSM